MEEQAIVVMTTVSSEAEADVVCNSLFEQGLAACIQEVPITSRYRWEGELQRSREILLLVKTSRGVGDEAVRAIEAVHPYDVPEVLTVPVTRGSAAYLGWLEAESSGSAG